MIFFTLTNFLIKNQTKLAFCYYLELLLIVILSGVNMSVTPIIAKTELHNKDGFNLHNKDGAP